MRKLSKGFGLIELLATLVLTSIVLIVVYKYSIKGVRTMTDTTRLAAIEANARRAFNSSIQDLKFIGYNPKGYLHPTTNRSIFGIRNQNFEGSLTHIGPDYDSLTFSFYNPDFYPTIGDPPAPDPARECQGTEIQCTQSVLYIDNGYFKKDYFDSNSDQKETLTLLGNACVRFLYCDSTLVNDPLTIDCYCSSKLPSEPNGNCTDQSMNPPPSSLKFIMAVVPDQKYMSFFTSTCHNTALQSKEYIRFEKIVHLTNLR